MASQLKSGDILLFSGNGSTLRGKVFSAVIRLANFLHYPKGGIDLKWTHAAIVVEVDEQEGVCLVAEALNQGFNTEFNGKPNLYGLVGLRNKIKEGKVLHGRLTYPLVYDVKDVVNKYKGAGYGWLDIFQIGIYTLLGIVGPFLPAKVRKPLSLFLQVKTGASKIICSEACLRYSYDITDKKANAEKYVKKRFDLTTPLDMLYLPFYKWFKK